jgi:hypothetical protein
MTNSENSVIKTLTERGNVLLADYRPKCFITGTNYTTPQFPNELEWYIISDNLDRQLWRGSVVAPVIGDPSIAVNSLYMNFTLEIDVDLRGRVPSATAFALSSNPEAQETPRE